MSDRNSSRLWELFDALVELPPEEQQHELERLTEADSDLRRELDSLLQKPPSDFMDQPLLSGERGDFAAAFDAPAASGVDSLIGQVLVGTYQIESRIGQGSMGVVYRGQHLKLNKPIAIKVLHDIGVSPDDLACMVEEAATVASLRHANIVAVHDVGTHAGRAFMVMDFIRGVDLYGWLVHARERHCFEGGSLAQAFRAYVESKLGRACTGPLWSRPYSEIATSIMRTIARAAAHAHEAGYIHRDIAPKNVLITSRGIPCLIDFGVATLSAENVSQVSRETVKGTLEYVAPEQLDPETASRQPTVDVYGLGATLYHLLAGRQPFEGEPLQVFQQVLSSTPPGLRSVQPRVHRDLEAICFGAMEKRPQDRYSSASDLADDLDAFLDRRPVSRRSPTWLGRAGRWCRRRPAAAIALFASTSVVVLALVAGSLAVKESRRVAAVERQQLFDQSFAMLPLMATLDSDGRYATAPFPARSDDDLGALWARLVELGPDRPLLRWYRANWFSQYGQVDAARGELNTLRAFGEHGPVLDALESALISTDPVRRNQLVPASSLPAATSAFEHAMVGYVAIRQRQHALAYEQLTRAIELDPGMWMYADLRSVAGLESAHADLCLEDAVRVETELGMPSSRSLFVRAFVTRVGFPERADELWRLCLERGGDQHQPLHGRGELLYRAGRYDEAAALLRRAAELKPSGWRTYLLLSRCAEAQAAFAEADAALLEGIANLAPGRPPGGFEPLNDLVLERIVVALSWASHLVQRGATDEAARQLAGARERLAQLGESAGSWRVGIECELGSLQLALAAAEGERSPGEALGEMRQLHLAYLRGSSDGQAPSALISLNLGFLLMEQGPAGLDEAEERLLFASRDAALRREALNGLEALACLRPQAGSSELAPVPLEK